MKPDKVAEGYDMVFEELSRVTNELREAVASNSQLGQYRSAKDQIEMLEWLAVYQRRIADLRQDWTSYGSDFIGLGIDMITGPVTDPPLPVTDPPLPDTDPPL